jgi:hypothetical protein
MEVDYTKCGRSQTLRFGDMRLFSELFIDDIEIFIKHLTPSTTQGMPINITSPMLPVLVGCPANIMEGSY